MMEFTVSRSVFILATVILGVFACTSPWQQRGDDCYLFHSGAKTFPDAERFCQGTGGSCMNLSLASIEDDAEFKFVRDLVYKFSAKPQAFYLGAYSTPGCVGTWTDKSDYPICNGELAGALVNPCSPCDVTDSSCVIEKCMVAGLDMWLASSSSDQEEVNFVAVIGDHNCSETKLPFVCKARGDRLTFQALGL